jgi:hypothetical protein
MMKVRLAGSTENLTNLTISENMSRNRGFSGSFETQRLLLESAGDDDKLTPEFKPSAPISNSLFLAVAVSLIAGVFIGRSMK